MRSMFLVAVVGAAALGTAAPWVLGTVPARAPAAHFQAGWVYRASTPGQMARDADVVVVARHLRSEPGRVAPSSNGESAVSFELAEFLVERPIKGVAAGDTIVVERTSDLQEGGGTVFPDHDGGPFEAGERYLLFLKKQSDTEFFYQVNDEGRFLVGPGNRLHSARSGDVAAGLRGRSLAEAVSLLRQAVGAR